MNSKTKFRWLLSFLPVSAVAVSHLMQTNISGSGRKERHEWNVDMRAHPRFNDITITCSLFPLCSYILLVDFDFLKNEKQ